MLVGHTLPGARVKGLLPLLHEMRFSDSEAGTCGFVCHPQTPRIVNAFSAKRGGMPRSIVFPANVTELFEDNRHENDSPVLGVRTLDNKVYFFPIKESERESPPNKKPKSTTPQLRTVFAKAPSQLSVNNVVSMQQFPCVLCKNEVILFGKGLKGAPLVWKIPEEVCGSSLTEYVRIRNASKVVPELICDLSSKTGCVKSGDQGTKKDLILLGDSLGHVFWVQSPSGKDRKTENPQIFYTAETSDPICRIFLLSRNGGTLLDTIVIINSRGFVKVLWWNHVESGHKDEKCENKIDIKMEFQFQIDEENLSKSSICCSNGKILVSSNNGGIKVFNPFLQAQAFGVREKTRPTLTVIHQNWDIWTISDGSKPGSTSATIITKDGRIMSEEFKQDLSVSSSAAKTSNVLRPLIASTKALSCQGKVFEGIGNVLWSHLSVISEVLEILRIARNHPNSIYAGVNLVATDPRSHGLSIECKLYNKSVVKLSRGVWCFYLSVYLVPSSPSGQRRLKKFSTTIPISEDVEPDAVWTPPNTIFLEGMSAICSPFTVESFLILAKRGPVEDDEERQRLLAAKISAKAGLPAPSFMKEFSPSLALSLGEKRTFGGLDLLCVHPGTTALGGDKGFDIAAIGFERRLGTTLLHQVIKIFQEKSGYEKGDQKTPFPMTISLPGTKGETVANISMTQENTVAMLRIRAPRKYLFGIHAALLFEIVQCLDKINTEPDPHQMEWRSSILQIAKDMRVSISETLSKIEKLEQDCVTTNNLQIDVHVQIIDQVVADIYKISSKWILSDLSSCKLVILS